MKSRAVFDRDWKSQDSRQHKQLGWAGENSPKAGVGVGIGGGVGWGGRQDLPDMAHSGQMGGKACQTMRVQHVGIACEA